MNKSQVLRSGGTAAKQSIVINCRATVIIAGEL